MRTPIQWLSDRLGLNTLAGVLDARDVTIANLQREVTLLRDALPQVVVALEKETTKVSENLQHIGQNHAGAINDLHMRLGHYERTVPGIAGAKRALESRIRREQKRRQDLIAAHPELTEAARNHVLQTGQLPETAARPQADGGEGPESEAEMRAAEDATALRLVREAEGDLQAEAS